MGASLALLAVLDILTAFLPLVGERHGGGAGWVGALLALRGAGALGRGSASSRSPSPSSIAWPMSYGIASTTGLRSVSASSTARRAATRASSRPTTIVRAPTAVATAA